MDPASRNDVLPAPTGPQFEPTLWFSIDGEGIVTVNIIRIIRAEMGQHIGTALGRILADELEADWDKVRIIHVDTDPKWGLMVTGGSWSVWQTWPIFSRAGAAGRVALIGEGAKLLGVVDRAIGTVRVEKLTIVVDAGTVVDPDGAQAQVEGAALWGLSMALHEGTQFEKAQVKDTNLDSYMPLRIGDVPEMDISFVDSTDVPVGLGEPATTVAARIQVIISHRVSAEWSS